MDKFSENLRSLHIRIALPRKGGEKYNLYLFIYSQVQVGQYKLSMAKFLTNFSSAMRHEHFSAIVISL